MDKITTEVPANNIQVVESKPWYTSKTMWVNLIAVTAAYLAKSHGMEINAETQTLILVIINIILRAITKQPVNWGFVVKK